MTHRSLLTSVCVFLILVVAGAESFADFTVNNILAEVGVSAGATQDGFGSSGDTVNIENISLMVTEGVPGTADFQTAEAFFSLAVNADTMLGDFQLDYDSSIVASTGGIGDAGGLSNGIIVFNLAEQFEAISHDSETIFSDAFGEPVVLGQGQSVILDAGNYSLSFGSSAFIDNGDQKIRVSDSSFGVVSFNSTAVPEPATGLICVLTAGLLAVRRR